MQRLKAIPLYWHQLPLVSFAMNQDHTRAFFNNTKAQTYQLIQAYTRVNKQIDELLHDTELEMSPQIDLFKRAQKVVSPPKEQQAAFPAA